MATNSKIEWTDHTANFWWGCSKIASGCARCYAESDAKRYGRDCFGDDVPRQFVKSVWSDVRRWNNDARKTGKRARVFVSSMCDFFEEPRPVVSLDGRPLRIDARDGKFTFDVGDPIDTGGLRKMAFEIIDECEMLDFLLLTKRPDNIGRFWTLPQNGRDPSDPMVAKRENVWLGFSASDNDSMASDFQKFVDQRPRYLAAGTFLSAEPLLECLSFTVPREEGDGQIAFDYPLEGRRTHKSGAWDDANVKLDWVIIGGESGPRARECGVRWIESMVGQCQKYDVPVFVKQLGSNPFVEDVTDCEHCGQSYTERFGLDLDDRKGGDPDEWPLPDLNVRQMPFD